MYICVNWYNFWSKHAGIWHFEREFDDRWKIEKNPIIVKFGIMHLLSPMLMHILFNIICRCIYILTVLLLCCVWFVQVHKVYNLWILSPTVQKIIFSFLFLLFVWYVHLNCGNVITLTSSFHWNLVHSFNYSFQTCCC